MAILLQSMVMFGNAIGRGTFFQVGPDRHFGNEFLLLVGETSSARKGISFSESRRLFRMADSDWEGDHISAGLKSGPGLIQHLMHLGGENAPDPDKRLLQVETEFVTVLRSLRSGLSDVLRDAWDGQDLKNLTKKDPLSVEAPHVSIIGHITPREFVQSLPESESENGLLNRFLVATLPGRAKLLPDGGNLRETELEFLAERLAAAIDFGKSHGQMGRSPMASECWQEFYALLERDRPTPLLNNLLQRGSPHVVRLSMLYALLDQSPIVEVEHLEAALAVFRYVEESVTRIFGDHLASPIADRLLSALRRASPDGLTRQFIIENVFQRNVKARDLDETLGDLTGTGQVRVEVDKATGGRPKETWFATIPEISGNGHLDGVTSLTS
jgi:hypothetical protein